MAAGLPGMETQHALLGAINKRLFNKGRAYRRADVAIYRITHNKKSRAFLYSLVFINKNWPTA